MKPITDYLQPNAIPKVEEKCAADRFENAIREFGVGNACEWFGHYFDSTFALETVEVLRSRTRWHFEDKVNETNR